MRPRGLAFIPAVLLSLSVVFAAEALKPTGPAEASVAARGSSAAASPENIFEVAYLLTWERDPRFRGRDPFQTVLHGAGSQATKKAAKLVLPRTPSEELAFAEKAASCVKEAGAALSESDFKSVQGKIDEARQMVAVAMTSQAAKDRMSDVSGQLAALEQGYAKVRARAALAESLQIAARMQAYFESERYGEVVSADVALQSLNNESGLQNPEVAGTSADVLATCAEIRRRAEVHLEFAKKELKVDAVSYFPEGRSFAIVNGEVFGEGAQIAPELMLAAVAGGKVTFDFKGEKISQGLAEPQESPAQGKRGKEGKVK